MKRFFKSLLQGTILTVEILLLMVTLFFLVDLCLSKGIEYLLGGMVLLIFIGVTFAFYMDNEED